MTVVAMDKTNAPSLTTWIPLVLVTVLTVAYAVRIALRGRVHFERLEQQGSGRLLARSILEMGYWAIQPVARLLVRLHISASALSWTAFALGAVGGGLLAAGHFGSAGLVCAGAGILDALDGLVARQSGSSSQAGKVLDSTLDRYVEFFFLAGLAMYYRFDPPLQILTLFALLGSFMVSYSTALAEVFRIEVRCGGMRRAERMVYLIAGAILTPLSIAAVESARVGMPVGYPMVGALCLVAAFANASAVERFFKIRRILIEKK